MKTKPFLVLIGINTVLAGSLAIYATSPETGDDEDPYRLAGYGVITSLVISFGALAHMGLIEMRQLGDLIASTKLSRWIRAGLVVAFALIAMGTISVVARADDLRDVLPAFMNFLFLGPFAFVGIS